MLQVQAEAGIDRYSTMCIYSETWWPRKLWLGDRTRYVEGILQQRTLGIWNVTLDRDLPSTELDFTWEIC